MSRRHSAVKRVVLPDAKYNDQVVAKFINNVMEQGKKAVAEKIVYSAFDIMAQKSKQEALTVFHEAMKMLNLFWKSAPAASAVPRTKFRAR